ncbi:hypothetical protein [Actinoplanes sp. NPDC026623]|uniref:hypothetical protein n=1 Tax=Actinoplanes sp. NPDC026623 TaxID=3155610 RepID=UPI0033E28FB1
MIHVSWGQARRRLLGDRVEGPIGLDHDLRQQRIAALARARLDRMIPLGRHASVDEIARAVLFLASDDGGMSIQAPCPSLP